MQTLYDPWSSDMSPCHADDASTAPQPAASKQEHMKPPEGSDDRLGVSASEQPVDTKEESKKKRKGADKDESRKSKSSRRDEKTGNEKDKEKAKEKAKAKE